MRKTTAIYLVYSDFQLQKKIKITIIIHRIIVKKMTTFNLSATTNTLYKSKSCSLKIFWERGI